MPFRGSRAFSLAKSKKGADDVCILRNIRPIDDSQVYSSATLGKITVTSPKSKTRDRSFSLTNESQVYSLAQTEVDCNSNHSFGYKDFGYHPDLNEHSDEKHFVESVRVSNGLEDSSVQSKVLKPLHIYPNKFEHITHAKKSSGHTRSYSLITGPVLNGTATKISGPLPNYNPNQFPSLEKQQQALLLLAEKQKLSKASILESSQCEIDKTYFTVTASNSRELLKEFNSRSRTGTGGSKMAGKIQRTIRALYDGSSEKKISLEKYDSDKSLDDVDGMKITKPASLSLKVDQSRLGNFIASLRHRRPEAE